MENTTKKVEKTPPNPGTPAIQQPPPPPKRHQQPESRKNINPQFCLYLYPDLKIFPNRTKVQTIISPHLQVNPKLFYSYCEMELFDSIWWLGNGATWIRELLDYENRLLTPLPTIHPPGRESNTSPPIRQPRDANPSRDQTRPIARSEMAQDHPAAPPSRHPEDPLIHRPKMPITAQAPPERARSERSRPPPLNRRPFFPKNSLARKQKTEKWLPKRLSQYRSNQTLPASTAPRNHQHIHQSTVNPNPPAAGRTPTARRIGGDGDRETAARDAGHSILTCLLPTPPGRSYLQAPPRKGGNPPPVKGRKTSTHPLLGRTAMDTELLEIHPRELTFVFELKKQSSDSIQLFNNSDQYVKTTSPKKYCVRPNIGISKPKSTCDFTVTMQPQREAPPPYMQCKDKFLIQSTIIPYGTKEEDITSDLVRLLILATGKYIEEKKLRVVLIFPSPDVIPVNGDSEIGPPEKVLTQDDRVRCGLDKPLSELVGLILFILYISDGYNCVLEFSVSSVKDEKTTQAITEQMIGEIIPGTESEETAPGTKNLVMTVETEILKETVDANYVPATFETKNVWTKAYHNAESEEVKDLLIKPHQIPVDIVDVSTNDNIKAGHNVSVKELNIKVKETAHNLKMDVEVLKLKLNSLHLQLNEAEFTFTKLGEENNKATRERERLEQELALLRQKTNVIMGQVYDGFPLLFVCMVALVSLACGYLLRP
ncbi:hypothetical protein QQ045_028218 [Rhodiola kirilowii]